MDDYLDPGQASLADMNVKQRISLVPSALAVLSPLCSMLLSWVVSNGASGGPVGVRRDTCLRQGGHAVLRLSRGASGDVGGTFLGMMGGAGLLAFSGLAAFQWPRREV
ncbi:hypothetical protein [Arthrobacter sp. BF1]|uniref:hypothetical protein n=1 Tax=Arthrobacter sp. BF1 TaxID=2821145 RepID=UPI001C4FAF6D|nr:hypothetical protein [Arthrobacter sp. BF1]